MNLQKQLATQNDCYKSGKTISPKGIMVHSTGANNPTLRRYVGPDDGLLGVNKNKNYWNNSGSQKCVHAFIGKLADGSIATYQILPWNMRGWHAASGPNGSANDTHISFEICEDGLTDARYFNKVYQEAVELCAYLCKEYNLDPLADGVLICHSEGHTRGIASGHADVMHWFPKHGKSMDTCRADVAALIGGKLPEPAPASAPESGNPKTLRQGDTGADVVYMQNRLIAHGFSFAPYGVDGSFGPATLAVLKAFQLTKGLEPDGVCGPKTWAVLEGVPSVPKKNMPTLRRGDCGPDVKSMQEKLIRAGFFCGKSGADGSFGGDTESTVKAFQTAKKLDVDGICGPKTWAVLLRL